MINTLTLPEIIPFKYQVDALNCIEAAEKEGKHHALVVMASGLGKTIVAALFGKRHLARKSSYRFLFLCHQNQILEQAQSRFQRVLGDSYTYGFFHGYEKTDDAQILFASFQTMKSNLDNFRTTDFDFIIVDETHHAMADTYLPVLEYFDPEFMLGITATPERGDEQDISEIYGKAVYTLLLPDALAQGLLCPVEYKLMTDEISLLEEIQTPHGRMGIGRLNRLMFIPKRDEEIGKLIVKEMEKISNPRVMVFCNSIDHAERMAEIIEGAIPIHSRSGTSEKRVRIEFFRQGVFPVGVTVDMFNEALDIPETNLIVFLRSTRSSTIYYQQLGRGLRPHPTKSKVIILDFVGNCERIATVYDLWKEVKETRENLQRAGGEWKSEVRLEPFALNVDTVRFQERIIPLINYMERSRGEFYLTWEEAAAATNALGISTEKQYHENYSKDPRLPSNPHGYYSETWQSYTAFFGKIVKDYYGSLTEAREAANALGIFGKTDYQQDYKKDPRLHSRPDTFYKDEWQGWTHFLRGVHRTIYPTLAEAMVAVQKLGIKSSRDYTLRAFTEDRSLPGKPYQYYSDWISWENFLGLPEKGYYPFAEAKEIVRKMGIKTQEEYWNRYKEDPKLPGRPNQVYEEWKGMNDFLGTKRFEPKREYYKTIEEASQAAKALGITTVIEYGEKYSLDPKLSATPSRVYKKDWKSWPHFLDKRYLTWQEASVAAIALNATSKEDYIQKYKQDPKLPGAPRERYKDFPGWAEFLGKK